MRVSFLCHEFPPIGGGAASALEALTEALALRGHDVHTVTIALGRKTTKETDKLSRSIIRLGAGRRRILVPTPQELLCSYAALRFTSYRHLRAFAPDILVGYFAFPAGRAALALGRRLRRPVVVSLRGSDVPGFSDSRWGPFRRLQQALVMPVFRKADLLLANGNHLLKLAKAFLPACKVVNLPNGVDTDRFHPLCKTNRGGPLRILFVGQLIERKHCVELLQAMKWLGTCHVEAELTIIGDGPQRPVLDSMSRTLPKGIQVHLAGAVSRERMPEVYRSHGVLAHLSDAEGVSNVLLEAMASGLSIVATPAAAAEVLEPGTAGVIVDDITPERVGQALRTLADCPDERRRLQTKARQIAERFSWDVTAESFERLVSAFDK